MIHKRILSLFGNITRLTENAIEYKLAKRQLEIKTFKSHSWFIVVKKILIQYELPDPELLLDNVLEKYAWKKRFHTAINKYWTERIVSQSKLYSSLKHLSKTYVIGKCHPAVRPYLYSDRGIYRIPVKNKVLTGTYILQTNTLLSNATVGALIRNIGPSESMIRLSFNMAAASHTWLETRSFNIFT